MIQKFTVSRDDNIYEAWPDLVMTEKGKLICTFTECAHHGDRTNSRIMITESLDRGRTWSKKQPLSFLTQRDFPFNNSRIARLPDNSLVVICDRVDSSQGGESGPNTCVYLWKGNQEGTTWSEPVILPNLKCIVPDKVKILKCGRWVIGGHFKNVDTGKLEQYLWYSEDEGKTWSERITVAADNRYNLCEVSILEMPDETLVAFMRENSGQGIDCLKAISHDHGNTWEGVYNTPIPACHRPVAGFLSDGDILLTYRFMQGGKGWLGGWTQNLFAAIFDVNSALATARNEQNANILPIDHDRSAAADLGYSGWVQFDDGEIYVVTYLVDDAPKAQIRGYSFYKTEARL